MPDMTMIEKVARALCRAAIYASTGRSTIDKLVDGCWDDYIDEARAAIEAMREPSYAMLQAWTDTKCRELDPEESWWMAIDAALKGEANGN